MATLGLHSSANKFDFSTNRRFGFVGDRFVAETGANVGSSGAQQYTGCSVVRVNPRTGQVSDFIVHPSGTPGEIFASGGFNRPINVRFRGDTMFIVDFGSFGPGLGISQPDSGKDWVVTRDRTGARGSRT